MNKFNLTFSGEILTGKDPDQVKQRFAKMFAIDDPVLEGQFQSWAELGGGRYFSAKNQQGLSQSLKMALKIPYSVYDHSGSLVAEGEVGGDPLELEAGFYRVNVATLPPKIFERVEIPGEEEVTLEVGVE